MSDKNLDKIAAILNKAENTDNEHEREAFYAAAQKMSARFQIELEVARQHTVKKNAKQAPVARNIVIGAKGERLVKSRIQLFVNIGHQNGLKIYIKGDNSIDAFGMPSDIEITELFYSVIVVQMALAGDEFIHSGAYRKADPNLNAQTARSEFYAAFADRIGARLQEVRLKTEAEAAADYSDGSMALVLASKKDEVASAFRKEYGTGVWKAPKSSKYSYHARRAGHTAGEKARLGGERQLGQGRGVTASR